VSVIERLRQLQGDRSDEAFATELGIAQPTLSRIYKGSRGLGRRVAQKIARRYPELSFELAAFLLADDIPTEQRGDTNAA